MQGELDERTTEDHTTVVIRIAAIAAVGAALALGPELARGRLAPMAVLVAVAFGYAVALGVAVLRGRQLMPAWLATTIDGVLVLVACGLTGGAESIMVALLPLVVIAASVRGGAVVGRLAALGAGAGFTVGAVLGSDADVPLPERWLAGAWWTGFLVAAAVLVGVLVRMLERHAAAASRARALAEHDALQEERDLRARLLAAQQARLDGVRVVLHEFRTPVASLTALSADLAADRLAEPSRVVATRLLAEHAVHLRDMLDGLADVAVTEGSPIGRVRERTVPLAELADAVLDAAGVAPARRAPRIDPSDAAVRCDPQRLRRVLTNLVENAARHSGDAPVELELRYDSGAGRLVAEVRDRGPGLPPGQEGVVTAKGVAMGERRGTAGLGLWIVEALVAAMDGELALSPRDGGGLVARLELPLPAA